MINTNADFLPCDFLCIPVFTSPFILLPGHQLSISFWSPIILNAEEACGGSLMTQMLVSPPWPYIISKSEREGNIEPVSWIM